VNPEHVLNHGPVWKFFSDWRTGVPATFLLTMPLWMFNVLPSLDERTELAMITVSAGWLFFSAAGPLMRQWKRSRVATRVKALLQHEAELNAGACVRCCGALRRGAVSRDCEAWCADISAAWRRSAIGSQPACLQQRWLLHW
jgi:hypothetical protein